MDNDSPANIVEETITTTVSKDESAPPPPPEPDQTTVVLAGQPSSLEPQILECAMETREEVKKLAGAMMILATAEAIAATEPEDEEPEIEEVPAVVPLEPESESRPAADTEPPERNRKLRFM